MKHAKRTTLLLCTLVLLMTGMISGCKKNTKYCDTANCGANASCNDVSQKCICYDGYEGTGCTSEVRSRYYGSYLTAAVCFSVPTNYTMPISTCADGIMYFTINNFSNQGYAIKAMMHGGSTWNYFSISSQTVTGNGGTVATISGTGDLTGNNITMNYEIRVNGYTSHCSLTGTK